MLSVASCSFRRKVHRLGASKITQVDILPKELVTYCKETQTPLAPHQSEGTLIFGNSKTCRQHIVCCIVL